MALDRALSQLVAGAADRPILASHPVYQYLASRYGLNLRSVHFEPDQFPSAEGWSGLEQLLREHPAEWMLWEAQPLPEVVSRLRELGVRSVVFDPCSSRPESGDLMSVMRQNVASLRPVFSAS